MPLAIFLKTCCLGTINITALSLTEKNNELPGENRQSMDDIAKTFNLF
jgi:hypothetical protein